jgi:hypothetical protein
MKTIMKVKVKVTAGDIKRGIPEDECKCPIARALKRTFKTRDVEVHAFKCYVDGRIYDLPSFARTFIYRFDMGDRDVAGQPFEFELPYLLEEEL